MIYSGHCNNCGTWVEALDKHRRCPQCHENRDDALDALAEVAEMYCERLPVEVANALHAIPFGDKAHPHNRGSVPEIEWHNGIKLVPEKWIEIYVYWLLRAYQSGHREGWEPTPTNAETMEGICSVLANAGYDPNLSPKAKELLTRKPKFFATRGDDEDKIRR